MTEPKRERGEYPHLCELCMTPVQVVGEGATHSYESAYQAATQRIAELETKLKEHIFMMNEDHRCPICKSETRMRKYEYHPDMKGPKPYDIICTNEDCKHTYVPSFVENHIREFDLIRWRKMCEELYDLVAQTCMCPMTAMTNQETCKYCVARKKADAMLGDKPEGE